VERESLLVDRLYSHKKLVGGNNHDRFLTIFFEGIQCSRENLRSGSQYSDEKFNHL